MRIPCPLCGLRDAAEFTYDGDSRAAVRPAANAKLESWMNYVFWRANPAGKHQEIWHHSAGCRQFIEVTRDTGTHIISQSRLFETGG